MKTYTIHRIGLFPLLKYGFLFGLISAILPVAFFVFITNLVINQFVNWLNTLSYQIPIPVLPDIEINAVDLVGLDKFYATLRSLTELSPLYIIIFILTLIILIACLSALLAVLIGLIYNLIAALSGGLTLRLVEEDFSMHPSGVYSTQGQVIQTPKPGLNVPARQIRSTDKIATEPRLDITQPISGTYQLSEPIMMIGSDPNCHIQLDGLQPKHAQITLRNNQYILTDHSHGKTWLQGKNVSEAQITNGDTLQLGHYVMKFRG